MPKKTRKPKQREMQNVNRKAFLGVNKAGALEQAYMELSSAIVTASRKVEESPVELRPVLAYETLLALLLEWKETDSRLHYQFMKIEGAVR